MTRDTQGLLDDRDGNDADIYAALWAAAPFPRVPKDAPFEIKRVTIDIEDPKRVYAVHRASRRHNFQVLVEKYSHQLRYGCQNEQCTTSTCFSCRKRLAAGAPVRRYNATSARTLAVYLASQDNPEHGLCHNPSAPIAKRVQSLESKEKAVIVTNDTRPHAQPASTNTGDVDRQITESKTPSKDSSGTPVSSEKLQNGTKRKSDQKMKGASVVDAVEEMTITDHKSFVQNVFGTVAFKMLEWLTPRNLDIMAADGALRVGLANNNLSLSGKDGSPSSQLSDKSEDNEPSNLTTPDPIKRDMKPNELTTPIPQKQVTPISPIAPKGDAIPNNSTASESIPNTTAFRPSSPSLRRKTEQKESQLSKGIFNISASPKTADMTSEMKPLSRELLNTTPRQKLQQTVTGSTGQVINTAAVHDGMASPPIARTMASEFKGTKSFKSQREQQVNGDITTMSSQLAKPSEMHVELSMQTEPGPVLLPQSIGCLSVELIDFICDILQMDDKREKHSLEPETIGSNLKREEWKKMITLREFFAKGSPSRSSKDEWRKFIEQSLFDVLSRPESLLSSFIDDYQKRMFDTQTIWYLMLRMTRAAPSLVFDSLWIAAGTLFQPPEKTESIYEWPKQSSLETKAASRNLSNTDAARVMNLCLHALVAAAPLVKDARQLANMSRIRSYGLTTLGRNMASLEPAILCLQYDDAFTNDLALRLARRLFAAIPTRRRFAELLELQKEARSEETREQDILDAVLSTLKFLDSSPIIYFSAEERMLHEARVPVLILDWARTVMLQDWIGTAEVPGDGSFGGALAMMAAIYKNRKSLLLGDIHFRTEYFADRLDPIEMPIEWLNFEPNRRTVHLLDHPYLFTPSTLVTYFRAINYSRMNQAYETAKATYGLMRVTAAENNLMTDQARRMRLYDRLSTATARFMVLEISRDNVLQDTFNSIWRREERELMRPLKIRLGEEGGEEGLDSGGVQQEFFRLAIAEALNPKYGTFTIDERTKMTWFQPGSPEPLWKFELIGMIVSLAVYNGLTLPVTFPKALYRKLLDEDVTELHHISDGWPDLANGLTTLLEWDESNGLVEDVFTVTYEFSVDQFGQPISREMNTSTHWPQFNDPRISSNPSDAPLVTNTTRNNYVSDYIRWLTDISVRPQFDAFKAGFFTCVDRRSITLFDPDTLQSLVEGVQEIDISELRRATRYVGWEGGSSHRTVRDFWSIVKRYDLEHKKKLLEFVTASDRVPVGGMRNLQFNLQKNGVDDGHLPSSYTCYGVLLLPEYSSKEVLRQKLAMALENSKGFGFA